MSFLTIQTYPLIDQTYSQYKNNAAKVIKKRAVNFILDFGTELSDKGVLTLKDIGRGARLRPSKRNQKKARVKDAIKQKKRQKREMELVIT